MQPFYPYLLLFTLFSFSCEKWTLEEENFLQVEITAIDSLSVDSVRIEGRIKGLRFGQLQDHGFLWTTQDNPPDIFVNEGHQPLGGKTQEDAQTFSTILKLEPNTRYAFRAYATVDGEEYLYSEMKEYLTGNGKVFTLGINYEGGLSLEASGRLSETEKGIVALKHGFCWSTVHPLPTLADDYVDLGYRPNNDVFSYILGGLEDSIPIYLRAYAILSFSLDIKQDTVYGQVLAFDENLYFWARKQDFRGEARSGAVGFSIGQKGYIGTGSIQGGFQKDFWEYDPRTDVWCQKEDFAGEGRFGAVGFSIGQKGYIGTGNAIVVDPPFVIREKDFWEYDQQTNTWSKKTDFAGEGRYGAIGFSIGQKGYIGTGFVGNGNSRDFWEYDPQTDSWVQKEDFGGSGRVYAIGFSIGQKGYIGTGQIIAEQRQKDFWEYNPQTDGWSRKADFGGGERAKAVGFSIEQKGYIGTGAGENGQRRADFWEYNPQTNIWIQKLSLESKVRAGAVGFSSGRKGYIGIGSDFQDFWEYDPD